MNMKSKSLWQKEENNTIIAVLALQGAFIEHERILSELGVSYFELRQKKDLDKQFDGLIIPGGESTVMGKLLDDLDMLEVLKKRILEGFPVFGTCAGLILLAKQIDNTDITYLSTMDIVVKKNAYGRQLGSFYTENYFKGIGKVPMTFIRAPYIIKTSDQVEILSVVNAHIVAAQQHNQLVTAFHPELNNYLLIHQYFINMVKKYMAK
ncbi:MAG: pyridoxal 5'-phosphate synthase glutaminase subunit PdxT [Bacilli bacterium]